MAITGNFSGSSAGIKDAEGFLSWVIERRSEPTKDAFGVLGLGVAEFAFLLGPKGSRFRSDRKDGMEDWGVCGPRTAEVETGLACRVLSDVRRGWGPSDTCGTGRPLEMEVRDVRGVTMGIKE